jgi:predicted AAA+ superfamily ATPase
MLFQRKLLKSFEEQINKPEIVVLTGMRRVGKTTLLNMVFEKIESDNKVFLDLTNPIHQMIFEEKNYDNIWSNLKEYKISDRNKAYIFLDEIQQKPDIVNVIKYFYDHFKVKFYLTGSSSFYFKNLFPESLAGRKIVYEIFPLDFEEFLIFKKQNKTFNKDFKSKEKNKNKIAFEKYKKFYEEYLLYGGFPQVVIEEKVERKRQWLEDIFKSYFEIDVRTLADFKDINIFRDLIFLLLKRTGTKLEIDKISSELGVSRPTVYSYISFLQGTYFVYLISPFTKNIDREVSGTKKIYICDNGIVNYFSKIDWGSLLENAVFLNLAKYDEIKYYQKRKGPEIDFILMNKSIGFEVKETTNSKEYIRLKKITDFLDLKEFYMVSNNFYEGAGTIIAQDI